jgi:predicted patatin/cPLA2 family phospholipase
MKGFSFWIFISTVYFAYSVTCNALAFGGGGALGSHSAGAFSAFANLLPPSEVNYTVITGISAGSLNSVAVTQYPSGSEIDASNYLLSLWHTVNGSQSIYEEWTGGLVAGLLFHSGLYSTEPLYSILKKYITKPAQRRLSMGTVEINSGRFQNYNETLPTSGIQTAAMCSSAIPVLFQNRDFNGGVYCDGGLFQGINAVTAVERCFEVTDQESEINLDIFSCFPKILPNEASKMRTPEVIQRAFEVRSYTGSVKSIKNAKQSYPNVNYRYFVAPTMHLPSLGTLNFTQAFISEVIQDGYSDGQNVIKSGPNLKTMIELGLEKIIYPI